MNKVIIGILAVALVGFVAIGLGGNADSTPKENKVGVTIFPIYDITREIAGEEMEVTLLLPAGSSPHTFDPSPQLLENLSGAKGVLAVGYGLDSWAESIATSIDAPVITLEDNIILLETEEAHDESEEEHEDEEEHEEEDEHGHGPIDPHYWLSITNAKQITLNIAQELGELDADNASLYQERAEMYVESLTELENELQERVSQFGDQNIVSLHDAWYYFADEFGVTIVGTFEPSAGREPTAQYLQALAKEIEESSATTVFIEPQLSSAPIESFANDNNLGIAILDPLGGVEGRESYIELMRFNVEQLVTALSNE